MAYEEITGPLETTRTFIADSDDDKTTIETDHPNAPTGTAILAGNEGTPRIYLKFPSGSFYKIYGEDAT